MKPPDYFGLASQRWRSRLSILSIPAGTVGKYRTGQQSDTLDPPYFVLEKIPANFEQYRPVPGIPAGTVIFFIFFIFLSFVIFEFLLGQNGNLFALTY